MSQTHVRSDTFSYLILQTRWRRRKIGVTYCYPNFFLCAAKYDMSRGMLLFGQIPFRKNHVIAFFYPMGYNTWQMSTGGGKGNDPLCAGCISFGYATKKDLCIAIAYLKNRF